RRFKMIDIPASVSKSAPDFCTVHVISKTKIASVRNAFRQAPFTSPLLAQIQKNVDHRASEAAAPPQVTTARGPEKASPFRAAVDDTDLVRSPFSKARGYHSKMFGDPSEFDSDISFISSDRPSTDRLSIDRIPGMLPDSIDARRNSRLSTSSDSSYGSIRSGTTKASEMSSFTNFSSSSMESDDVETEMRRLKLELQKTMEMYSTACKEALTAKQKASELIMYNFYYYAFELHKWRVDEERRMEETRLTEDSARLTTEQESGKRSSFTDSKDKGYIMSSLQYRRYSIEEIEEATESFSESRKVGEGGYGPVFKCYLDHTPVAVKVLRPDAAQGRSQFQQEVEVLSCLRHPNMVLLLGACPEYGCLVYEYMANGSLEDRLFRRGNTRALSWPLRFRIAAEISTGLHFLHQKKPEPLVHRDFKPANILLDQNYVSKISDVGLARLVPPSVAEETQYHMTSTAGTFCYIDPEYQQTGMLGTKSDIYSLGVVLLQILTAKPAMGLTHYVGRAIEKGTFSELLDPAVPDWPVDDALQMAKLALQCAELRRKDRPDLGKVILPELDRLRDLGEENFNHFLVPSKVNSTTPS
ncbi:hypothetical protein M569_12933, partial [Genlisea aurea]